MNIKKPYTLFLVLFYSTTQILLGDFEFLNGTGLIYDTTKSYSEGDSVVLESDLESDRSEIYTALIDVPPGNPPVAGSQSQYWSASDETTSDLTSQHSDDISTVPTSNFDPTTPGTTPSDGPAFPESAVSVNFSENSAESVATIFANFADSYQISSEKDGILFTLDQSNLQLSFQQTPDYETPSDEDSNNVYEIVIVASNDNGTDSQTISVTVENVIEVPVFDDGFPATVDFTSEGTGSVYTASATDGATYSITGGANSSLFSINSATGSLSFITSPTYAEGSSNTYSVTITATNSQGSIDLSITVDVTSKPTDSVDIKLKGISTNAIVTSDAWMVAGVTITGGTKKVVFQVQASGTYGTDSGYLADPILYITNATGYVVAIVDNWKDGPNAGYDANLYNTSYLAELQSSVYAMAGDEECAIVLNLPEGSYTALVGSNGESSGKAVVAAFDFETGASVSNLKGISTNAIVTSDAWMVAGVTITGGTKKVVFQVQASGTYGTDSGYLADPILYITNATGYVVAIVDNWKDGPNAGYDANLYNTSYLAELQSSVYAMAGDEECAIVLNLPEGSYTALVGSNGESSGKAVVAAFDFEE